MNDVPHANKEDAGSRELGKDISFGLQQTLACWATDFIDPYIGSKVQDHFEDASHKGSLKYTWAGEIIGDGTAFFTFLGIQRFAPGIERGLAEMARSHLHAMLERTGKSHLKVWAEKEGVDVHSDAYRAKLAEWERKQSENIAKSAIISLGSIAANVAAQKALGNSHTLAVITASKLTGAAITLGAMLGLRNYLPKTTEMFDEELNERYFSPLIRKTQKTFGAVEDRAPRPHKEQSHAHRALKSRDAITERVLTGR